MGGGTLFFINAGGGGAGGWCCRVGDEELWELTCHKSMRPRVPGCGSTASLGDKFGWEKKVFGLTVFCFFSHSHPAPPSVRNLIWGLCTASGLAGGRHEKGSCCGQGERRGLGVRRWSGEIVSSSNATPEQFPERSALESAADRQSDCRCRTRSQALFKCKSGCVTRLHGAEGGSQIAPSLWRILEVEKTF